MAKNLWKYASLPETERLNMIKSGNKDVYDTEIARLDSLSNARKSAGLTNNADIDMWKENLVAAQKKAVSNSYKVTRTDSTPVFYSGDAADIMDSFNQYMTNLKKEYQSNRKAALKLASGAKAELEEWLASNGLSNDGKTAVTKNAEIDDQLYTTIEKLTRAYNESAENARSSTSKKIAQL